MANQNEDIITYFQKLDRGFFIDELKEFAYMDEAIPIGHEQTISQPSLVLEMTVAINLQPDLKALEIGTGSGYQTALLAAFSNSVYTIERIFSITIFLRLAPILALFPALFPSPAPNQMRS
ncbi:protein-L-isoaspartate O-methyltransferase family protein [Sporosarcina koreensis]|uniref:protein-L-isoaspartate O-methyltransferase family protein n=1 Tax=Bacillales TaxID=1385 RepID=UPI000755BC04|nr:hypothetical protein [Sporosarcina koreensis]